MAERWGDAEIHFRPDPAFGPFAGAAFTAMLAAGSMYAHVARDRSGIRACLVTFVLHSRAAAILVGVSVEDDVRRLSLGKHLFDASIETAIGAGCTTYDFLWVGGYKEAFWHARPRRLESILVGRGPLGSAAANYVALRRVVLPTLLRRWARARNAS
jgi:CelD/BcsL family acetyltransferase involved in cellulose biosynthesis